MVGFDRRFWHYGEIINLPIDRAFSPSSWWGMNQECAHVLLYLWKDWFDLDEAARVVRDRIGRPLSKAERVDVSELLFDLFDFEYCFGRDWAFYFKSIWGYLAAVISGDEYVRERLRSYVFRSFGVFLLDSTRREGGDFDLGGTVLRQRYMDFAEHFSVLGETSQVSTDHVLRLQDSVLLQLASVKSVLPKLMSSIDSLAPKFEDSKKDFGISETRKAIRSIERGEVATGNFNPVELVVHLARSSNVSIETEIAAILSLWNFTLIGFADIPAVGGAATSR